MPKSRANNKHCTFQDVWLDENVFPEFYWIRKCQINTNALCIYCPKTIDLSNMGISALRSHATGKKHLSKIRAKNTSKNISNSLFCSKVGNKVAQKINFQTEQESTSQSHQSKDTCTVQDASRVENINQDK